MRIARRPLLVALTAVPLAACTATGKDSPESSTSPTDSRATDSPASTGKITATIFQGAFGTDYIAKAGEVLKSRDATTAVDITATTDIAEAVEAQLKTGTPPDLIDNSGPKQFALAAYTNYLEDLTSVVDSPNLEGSTIRDTLYGGVLNSGRQGERLLSLNYALSVYGLWYSSSRLAAAGMVVPTAWDHLIDLGKELQEDNGFLFVWSPDAANYYQELAISSAIKEGGHDVRRRIDNLDPACWSHPAVTAVLSWLETCVTNGFFLRQESYLKAQTAWVKGQALLYPSGAWIAKEMALESGSDFALAVAPVPSVTAAPTLPASAVHAAATEQLIVPTRAKNPAGAKELLRVMLSKEISTWFAAENLLPTVVRGSVPTDNQSTALASQTRLLADAGEDVFSWRFDSYYGLAASHNELWAKFLAGESSASDLATGLQELTDKTANDSTLDHYTVD